MNLTPEQNERLSRHLFDEMERELDKLEGRLWFWRILSAGLAITIIVILILWPN